MPANALPPVPLPSRSSAPTSPVIPPSPNGSNARHRPSPDSTKSDLDPRFDEILFRALAKEPALRQQSARQLSEELAEVSRSESTPPKVPSDAGTGTVPTGLPYNAGWFLARIAGITFHLHAKGLSLTVRQRSATIPWSVTGHFAAILGMMVVVCLALTQPPSRALWISAWMLALSAQFDRDWATTLMTRAIGTLADEYRRADRTAWFEQLKPWLAGSAPPLLHSRTDANGPIHEAPISPHPDRLRPPAGHARMRPASSVHSTADPSPGTDDADPTPRVR